MAMHYKPVHSMDPTTKTMPMRLHLFRLLNERRKDLKNIGQSTWVDMIFIDTDVFYLLFPYILLLYFSITNGNFCSIDAYNFFEL